MLGRKPNNARRAFVAFHILPRCAKASPSDNPIPEPPPVMSIVLPVSFIAHSSTLAR